MSTFPTIVAYNPFLFVPSYTAAFDDWIVKFQIWNNTHQLNKRHVQQKKTHV